MVLKKVLLIGIAFGLLTALACGAAEEATPTPAKVAATPTAAPTSTPTPKPAEPKRGGVIKAVNEAGVPSLDPLFTSAFATRNVAAQFYETITTFDANWAIKPLLADWEISGDTTLYTFTVRQGAKFHDDRPVTSADLIASIERLRKAETPATFSGTALAQIEQIETVNDRVFKIKFKRPVATILNILAAPAGRVPVVMPKEVAATTHLESVTSFVGTGPYKVKNWVKGDRVELARFEGYVARTEPSSGFAGKRTAYADEIHILEVGDETTRLAGLEAGQIDYVHTVSTDYYSRLKANKDVAVYLIDPGQRPFVWFNNENPPTDNQKMRRAIADSWNHESALTAAAGSKDFYRLCYVMDWCEKHPQIDVTKVVGGKELYNVNDKERARREAQEAGYKGEKIIVLGSQDIPFIFNSVQVLVQNMRDAGFNVEFKVMDDAAVKQARAAQTGWNMLVTINSWANAVPSRFRTAPVSSFVSRYHPSQRLQDLAVSIHFETDPAKWLEQANEIQKLYYEEAGSAYFLGEVKLLVATRATLKGYTPNPVMWLVNTWQDK